MKKLAFCVCLLAIGGIGTMGTNACSSSSNASSGSSSGSDSGDDSSSSSGSGSSSGGEDSSSSSGGSSSSGSGSGGSSSGTDSGPDAPNCQADSGAFMCPADDAGNAPPPPFTNNDGCNTCLGNCCADTWCTCAGDTKYSAPDDAGNSTVTGGCLAFVLCFQACYTPADGGPSPGASACTQQCGPMAGSTQAATEGGNLITCIAGSCNTMASCGG